MTPLTTHDAATAAYVLLPTRMDTLLVGVLCAWAVRQKTLAEFIKSNIPLVYAVGTSGLIALCTAYGLGLRHQSTFMNTIGFNLLWISYAALLLAAVTERSGLASHITKLAPFRRLGVLAYGIFLLHPFVPYYVLKAYGLPAEGKWLPDLTEIDHWVIFLASVALMIGIADLSWRYFESPLLSLGRRLAGGTPKHLAMAIPVIPGRRN
jgi:peptidoglycan/LPS O-acetylase OafA/YrhL